jgi:hypothetical protein
MYIDPLVQKETRREQPSASSLTRRTEENTHTTPIITNPSELYYLTHGDGVRPLAHTYPH